MRCFGVLVDPPFSVMKVTAFYRIRAIVLCYLWEIDHAIRVVLCLLAAVAASPAGAQGDANATVCAADDDSAFSAEQRIAACDALIKAARNAPKAVADALVNRGQAAWCADKMKQAFADLDRTIADRYTVQKLDESTVPVRGSKER